jgi:hypothetical protein
VLLTSCRTGPFVGSNDIKRNNRNQATSKTPGDESSDGLKDGSDKDGSDKGGSDKGGSDSDKDGSGSDGNDNNSDGNSSNNGSNNQAKPDEFAAKNKSLDAYLLVDTSESLEQTDRDCKRYDAVKSFKNSLATYLGSTGDARVTLILFNTSARFHSTANDFLKLSDSEFSSRYRSSLCQTTGQTNASAGFELVLSKSNELMANSKKEVASVLFFTDGLPNQDKDSTLKNADRLKQKFNSRIFSVYLDGNPYGAAAPYILPSAFPLPPEEFLNYVSGSNSRVRKVSDASGLAASMTSFLGQ